MRVLSNKIADELMEIAFANNDNKDVFIKKNMIETR